MQNDQNPHIVDPANDPYRSMTPEQMVNDPSVVYNPHAQYGIKMTYAQKRKFKKQIRLQMQSKSWFQDKYQSVLVQRNILVILSVIALMATLLSVYLAQQLAPLKSVEPFIIQIEEKSGITQVVDPVTRDSLSQDEALDNYFLWAYVRARETYHPADQRRNWEITRVMSNPRVFEEYLRNTDANTPTSAAAVLGGAGTRVLRAPTITYLDSRTKPGEKARKVAQVRFLVEETFKKSVTRYPKIATIEYDYYEIALKRNERLSNPLGFQVISYRLDDEAVMN